MSGEYPTNAQLFEMLQTTNVNLAQVQVQMSAMNTELVKTQTIIRDYNGLRERVEEVANLKGHVSWDKVLTALSIVIAIVAVVWK